MANKKNDSMSTDEAVVLFDSLEPAKAEQMIGCWRGEGIDTDHPMDGMLEASYWYGKEFLNADEVHPLIHKMPIWGRKAVNPGLMPVRLATKLPLRHVIGPVLMPLLVPLICTKKTKARLRTIGFRGRQYAAMCYDQKPIHDIFAQLDNNTMMGWMDFKGMDRPYFFKLYREAQS